MFVDREYRPVSCHDTWISIDPIVGCPYSCGYCVLRHSGGTGTRPRIMLSPPECVERLLKYSLFVRGSSRLAIGNETDMFNAANVDYLVELLKGLKNAGIENYIALITKAPLDGRIMARIRAIDGLKVVFCLSYSGLGRRLEPNFTDESLRANFEIVRRFAFPILHFWRPLLPENTTASAVETMLSFVANVANASVIVGMKLHPDLTRIVGKNGLVVVPSRLREKVGEWLDSTVIEEVYTTARRLCPGYPLYRHTSCALAMVMSCPNHTGTVYRGDICGPSECPVRQRQSCEGSRLIPSDEEIGRVLARLGRRVAFSRSEDGVLVSDAITQEEYCYAVQNLSCPVTARTVEMQNLYYGSINDGRWHPVAFETASGRLRGGATVSMSEIPES